MEIVLAKEWDIVGWMNLVNEVKENFPRLETKEALEEHRKTVLDFISRDSAICAKSKVVTTQMMSAVRSGRPPITK